MFQIVISGLLVLFVGKGLAREPKSHLGLPFNGFRSKNGNCKFSVNCSCEDNHIVRYLIVGKAKETIEWKPGLGECDYMYRKGTWNGIEWVSFLARLKSRMLFFIDWQRAGMIAMSWYQKWFWCILAELGFGFSKMELRLFRLAINYAGNCVTIHILDISCAGPQGCCHGEESTSDHDLFNVFSYIQLLHTSVYGWNLG